MVIEAGQPEIFRAVQRDDVFIKHLQDSTSDIVLGCVGLRKWIAWREHIRLGSKILYLAATTLRNLQTLGEEYTGIVHWTDKNRLPSKQMQALMILLDCFGEKFVNLLLSRLEEALEEDESLRPEARSTLLKYVTFVQASVTPLLRLHKAIFYWHGRYYHVSKRTTGIRYALVRFWLRDRTVASKFRLLGAISFINQLVSSFLTIKQGKSEQTRDISENQDQGSTVRDKCSLCLNSRVDTASTPCGHLFCWNCIMQWLGEETFCPLCRLAVHPSRVVLLRNF